MPIPQGRRVNFLVGVLDEGMSFNAIINRDFVWVAIVLFWHAEHDSLGTGVILDNLRRFDDYLCVDYANLPSAIGHNQFIST